MAKNIIPEVLKLLGLEVGEEFKVKGSKEILKFDEEGMLIANSYKGLRSANLPYFLNGTCEIEKLPFNPKKDDPYWLVVGGDRHPVCKRWDDHIIDFAFYKLGNCFRTREEAEANAERIRKEIMG